MARWEVALEAKAAGEVDGSETGQGGRLCRNGDGRGRGNQAPGRLLGFWLEPLTGFEIKDPIL